MRVTWGSAERALVRSRPLDTALSGARTGAQLARTTGSAIRSSYPLLTLPSNSKSGFRPEPPDAYSENLGSVFAEPLET